MIIKSYPSLTLVWADNLPTNFNSSSDGMNLVLNGCKQIHN